MSRSMDLLTASQLSHLRIDFEKLRDYSKSLVILWNRLSIDFTNSTSIVPQKIELNCNVQLNKEHHTGPLLLNHPSSVCVQYEEMHDKRFWISTKKGDACHKIGDSIVVVRNILKCDSDIFVIHQVFSQMEDFFTYPIKSSKIVIKKRYWPSKKLYWPGTNRYWPVMNVTVFVLYL